MVYTYDERERLFTGHTGRLFLLVTALWFTVSLTSRLLPPLLPAVIDDLAITAFLAGVAMTGERMVRALVEFPGGRLADAHSRTTVLLVCAGLVVVGVTVLSGATSYGLLLGGLLVFGTGRGLYSPAGRALLSDLFREKRGRAFGLNMMGSEAAGILGAVIAVVIVGTATWRAAFLPLAAVTVPLLIGLALLSREPLRLGTIDLGARETGRRLFADRTLRRILFVYSLYVLSASGVSTFLPLFLIEVHGASFAVASSAFALLYVAGLLAKPVSGMLSDAFPRLTVAAGSFFVGSCGLAVVILAPTVLVALGGVVVYALGYRGAPPGLQAFLMDRFPDDSMGGDLGAMRTVYLLVGSLGPAYAGLAANTVGFVPAFLSFVAFFLVGATVLFSLSTPVLPSRS